MTEPFDQYVFPPLVDEKGKVTSLKCKAGDRAAYSQALGFKIENPDANNAQIARHLLETVWAGDANKNANQAEAATRRWQRTKY
jgi:hypothetical protein